MTDSASTLRAPPDFAIRAAVQAGIRSLCAKSKRGAAVFDPRGTLLGVGFNGQPAPFACTGSAACRASCGKLCAHAEQRALREARTIAGAFIEYSDGWVAGWSSFEIVHAKVVDGALVAGGGPSCWQCSREILDVGLAAVWLYEEIARRCLACRRFEDSSARLEDRVRRCMECGADLTPVGEWRRYSALEFHGATARHHGLTLEAR